MEALAPDVDTVPLYLRALPSIFVYSYDDVGNNFCLAGSFCK